MVADSVTFYSTVCTTKLVKKNAKWSRDKSVTLMKTSARLRRVIRG